MTPEPYRLRAFGDLTRAEEFVNTEAEMYDYLLDGMFVYDEAIYVALVLRSHKFPPDEDSTSGDEG